jgi:hypothetical protein
MGINLVNCIKRAVHCDGNGEFYFIYFLVGNEILSIVQMDHML